MKKSIALLVGLMSLVPVTFAATDINQELDTNGGTLQVNNSLTINYEEGTFDETVVFTARTVSQIEGDIDAMRFDDKGSEAIYISFKNSIGLATVPLKDISFGYSDLSSYENPVLITYTNGDLEVFEGEDNAGTFVFELSGMIEGAFKIVEDLNPSSNEEDLLGMLDEGIELLSAPEEPAESNIEDESNSVILSDKAEKGVQDYYLIILLLGLVIVTYGMYYGYRKS